MWWFDSAGTPMVGNSSILSGEEAQDALIEQIEPEVDSFEFFAVIGELTDKQRFVIERRFGFFDGFEYTQQEIADAMGVTFQAVQSLEAKALRKFRWLRGDL